MWVACFGKKSLWPEARRSVLFVIGFVYARTVLG